MADPKPAPSAAPEQATRDRAKVKTEGGKIIRVEAHPIPEHPRPSRVKGRIGLVSAPGAPVWVLNP